MRKRELRRVEQRWARQAMFGQRRRRFPWRGILVALVLVGLVAALTQTDPRGLWGSIQSWLPAPEANREPRTDPNLLPLPPPGHN